MLELSLIILGKTPRRGIRIMRPGAMHRARWMARVIYSMKLLLFRQQFKLKQTEETGLTRFVMFCFNHVYQGVVFGTRFCGFSKTRRRASEKDLSFHVSGRKSVACGH